ncbi:hypothetical protein RB598_003286 [Gaeumannomyces tritici]
MEVSRAPVRRPRRQTSGAARGPSLHCAVPDEIMVRILYYVSPEENLSSFQLISRRHSRLANEPLLWKHYCRTSFRHWDPRHDFPLKLALPAPVVDWKRLWMLRRGQNARVLRLLDDILATKLGRVDKFGQICLLEYDAKDILLEQCRTPDDAEDVLARRYYAGAALESIHRGVAIKEWAKFQSPHAGPPRLDRALAAFDMFTLREHSGDIDDTEALLDSLARDFLAAHPGFEGLSTRRKALLLLQWVRSENLTGMDNPDTNYRNIQNCLLGHALRDKNHPSLPLVSSAIYASLAERVGMRAACCSFPAHVHVGVFAPSGETLDGVRPQDPPRHEPDMMYLDPYGADHEIHIEELRMRLEEYSSGWHEPGRREVFLKASPSSVLIVRAAHNIQVSCVRLQQARDDPPNSGSHGADNSPNMESMLYAVLWVSLLLTPTAQRLWDNNLEHFLNRFRRYFSEDAWLLRKYLAPLYDNFLMIHNLRGSQRSGWEDVHLALQMEQKVDERPLVVQRRDTWVTQHRVRYHVGQVFIHKRFHIQGIITGWNADSAESNFQNVADRAPTDDDLWIPPVYYTCLCDVDRIIVAEANIDLITDPEDVPANLMRAAGKFFRRFNRDTCTFESNVRESFPDD